MRAFNLFMISCLCVGLGACNPDRKSSATKSNEQGLAPSPREAALRYVDAMISADEATFRRNIEIRSPAGYSDAFVRWGFASGRLHDSVRSRGITGQRVRDAGWDRNETITPDAPKPVNKAELLKTRDVLLQAQWRIDGDTARPIDVPWFTGGTAGNLSVEREPSGWKVIISDPIDSAPADHLRTFANAWNAMADDLDATTARVRSGDFRSVREVNDYLTSLIDRRR